MKVGIIGAMEEEVNILKEKLVDLKTLKKMGMIFHQGLLQDVNVIVLQCGVGKVAAAVGTTIMIDLFSPDLIINTGSAGGMSTDLSVGDVVISTDVRYNDVDVTLFGYEYGQLPKMPPGFTPDESLVQSAKKAALKITNIHITEGLITTGDSFIHDPERAEFIQSKFPPIKATEMEAAAIAHVCHLAKVPFLIIRSISDVPGVESKQSFEDFILVAGKNSALLVEEIIKEIKE